MRLLLVLLAGCSLINDPDDHRPGGGLDPVPATEFCGGFAEVACDAFLDCCSTAAVDRDACILEEQADCNDRLRGLLLDPRTGYDPRVASEVLEEGRSFVTSCDVSITGWGANRTGFVRMFRGSVDPGGECTPMNVVDLPAYFSCRELDQACVSEGLFGSSFCRDLQTTGGRCNLDSDCVDDLYCAPMMGGGTCAPVLATGEPCMEASDCASQFCGASVCEVPTTDRIFCASRDLF